MNYKYLIAEKKADFEKLQAFGFVPSPGGEQIFQFAAEYQNISLHFFYKNGDFYAAAFDNDTKEQFLPFELKTAKGSFVFELKDFALNTAQKIAESCFNSTSLKQTVLDYAQNNYGTILQNPWNDENITLNKVCGKKQKWYGLVMCVKRKNIGEKDENLKEAAIDVMNVKAPPEEIEKIVDYRTVFPAYHMNKKHWITVLLSGNPNWQQVKELLDQSYQIV